MSKPIVEQEDTFILCEKLNNIDLEYEKLLNSLQFLVNQARKCVEELDHLQNPAVRKEQVYNSSEKLDLIHELISKSNSNLEKCCVKISSLTRKNIPHISVNSSTTSLKYLTGDSPWNFWLQECSADIKVLYKLLIEKFENGRLENCLSLPAVGDSVCYAERRKLYRGMVTQHLGERLKVVDVDTSCIKVLSLDKVFRVDADVCHLKAQAVKCCLSEDFDSHFMWSSDLGRVFTNVLRNGNLHVKIIKQLAGCPPQCVVEVKVENEDEEVALNVGEWICDRVLPELKEVYSDGVENLCDFLSIKALDPYYQEESAELTFHSLHTYSTDEPAKAQSVNRPDLCDTNSVEGINQKSGVLKTSKSPSVADLLERSFACQNEIKHSPPSIQMENLVSDCHGDYGEKEMSPLNLQIKNIENNTPTTSDNINEELCTLDLTKSTTELEAICNEELCTPDLTKSTTELETIINEKLCTPDLTKSTTEMESIVNEELCTPDLTKSTTELEAIVNEELCTPDLAKSTTELEAIDYEELCTPDSAKSTTELEAIVTKTCQSTFFSLDKAVNGIDMESLAVKLASNEFAVFKKEIAEKSFLSSDDLAKVQSVSSSFAKRDDEELYKHRESTKLAENYDIPTKSEIPGETEKLNKMNAKVDTTKSSEFEADKSSKNVTYFSDLTEENISSSDVDKEKSEDSDNTKTTPKKNSNSYKMDECVASSGDKSFCSNTSVSSNVSFNNKAQRTERSPSMTFIQYPHNPPSPFYNIPPPILPPQPYSYHSPPPQYSLPQNVWHQPNIQYYHPPYPNQMPGPSHWGNFNLFQGQTVQYPNHLQWSSGVNETRLPTVFQNGKAPSKYKTTLSEKVADSSQEKTITVEKKLPSDNNSVLEPSIDLLTPKARIIEMTGFGNLVTVAEDYHVKLKPPRTLLKPDENVLVMMAHIESPAEFYVHVVTRDNLLIDKPCSRFMNDMLKYYSNTELILNKSWKEAQSKYDMYCACKWPEDNGWYRVQVIDWNVGGKVLVQFVDYGNRDEVPLSAIQPLAKQFTNQPMMAQPCHLANVYPIGSEYNFWPEEAVNYFHSLFDMKEAYTAVVIPSTASDPSNSLAIAELYLPQQEVSVNDLLVEEGFAVSKSRSLIQSNSNGNSEIGDCVSIGSVQTPSFDEAKDWEAFNPLEEDYHSSTNCFNLDSENAKLAVTGYKGKDESNICRFFAKDRKCWKANCRKEHVLPNPDGVPDKVFARAFTELKLPDPGEKVHVRITHVSSVHRLFGQLQHSVTDEEEETLETLYEYMNKRSNIRQMQALDEPPVVGQLVIAKSYNGYWFRGRILGPAVTNNNEVEVMFVDYGTEESIYEQDLRQIEPRYLHLPFQAVECILANVDPPVEEVKNKRGIKILKEYFIGKTLIAKVHSSSTAVSRLEVFLKDKENLDVGEWLIEKKICQPKHLTGKITFNGHIHDIE